MCFVILKESKEVEKSDKCWYCLTDSRTPGESGGARADAEAFERVDSCHRATAPEDHRFAER